jgi:hypothetical protein
MDYDKFIKDYAEGDDIPMAVGVMAIPGDDPTVPKAIFSSIFVDYAFSKKQEVCDAYTSKFEKMWENSDLDSGFEIRRTGDEQVYVSTKDKTFIRAFEGGHTKDFSGPVFFAEVNGEKDAIDKFFELKEKKTFWVIHFRTTAFSYMLILDHATGTIVAKHKMKPLQIFEREGETS